MKNCTTCKRDLPDSSFYASNKSHCKECICARVRAYAKTDAGKATERRRNQKPKRKARLKARAKAWNEKYPDRYKAHYMVKNAVRDGRLFKPDTCESCGVGGLIHGHHDDYSKPLDVRWLCPSCHATADGKAVNQREIWEAIPHQESTHPQKNTPRDYSAELT